MNDETNEVQKATPLVKTEEGNYMGPLGGPMEIEIRIKGGHKSGKEGAAQHFIDSVIERFGDERPIQVDHTAGETLMHSKKYVQTISASREYAPILSLKINESTEMGEPG